MMSSPTPKIKPKRKRRNVYTFLSPTGELVQTKSIREFADSVGMKYASARTLHSGHRKRINGWCSTDRSAKMARDRFMTVLVNTRTGERTILGHTINGFAKKYGLCDNELWKLVNGHGGKICYRGWMLEQAYSAVNGPLADTSF
jgi:hypothetical protein